MMIRALGLVLFLIVRALIGVLMEILMRSSFDERIETILLRGMMTSKEMQVRP